VTDGELADGADADQLQRLVDRCVRIEAAATLFVHAFDRWDNSLAADWPAHQFDELRAALASSPVSEASPSPGGAAPPGR
jgi:hypothetical protein